MRVDFLLPFSTWLTHRIVIPIMAEHRWLYPIDWPELSKLIRFGRAKGRCEHCQRPHGQRVFHLGDGRWWDADRRQWRDGRGRRVRAPDAGVAAIVRVTRVYIACAHLNHDPTDNTARNLAALCQRCHMIHDAAEHRRRRWFNAYRRRALGDLLARLDAASAGSSVPRGTPAAGRQPVAETLSLRRRGFGAAASGAGDGGGEAGLRPSPIFFAIARRASL